MIKRLLVRNYKSIRELDISLKPLMVLVGPNASGKSNLLDVFKFLKETSIHGSIDTAINIRGGYKNVVWNGKQESTLVIQISGDRLDEREHTSPFNIVVEAWSKDNAIHHNLTQEGSAAAGQRTIQQWAFYHFYPQNMRPPQPVQKQNRLNEDGSNLSTVIHSLYSDGDPSYPEIEELFKVFVPEAEKLVSPLSEKVASHTYAAFRQKGLNIIIGTGSMSDGTLFGLALIVALFAPDRPQLICIEAPDVELHPYLMEHVAALLRTASQYAQIIITTHSPFLLDYLPAESIAVVEKINGETKVWWAQDRKGVKQAIKLLGAGEAWRAGHLGGVPA